MRERNGHDGEVRISEPRETSLAERRAMAAEAALGERMMAEAEARAAETSPSGFAILSEHQAQVLALALGELTRDADERLKAAVASLREEMSCELACLRDEILAKLDARLLGRGLHESFDPGAIDRAIHQLRSDLDQKLGDVSRRTDTQAARLSLVEEHGGAIKSLSVKLAHVSRKAQLSADLKARIDKLDERLDEVVEEYRSLHRVLADAEIVAPEPPTIATAAEMTTLPAALPRFITEDAAR